MVYRKLVPIAVLLIAVFLFTGCMTPEAWRGETQTHQISVEGVGIAEASPDSFRLSVSISELAKSTVLAQSAVNEKIAAVIEAAVDNGVLKQDIHTESISMYPEYQYREDRRELVGQRVRQNLSLSLKGIDEDEQKIGRLLDALGLIDSIEISSVQFTVEDTEALYEQAREAAYRKAEAKALQFAEYGKVSLGKPISISEYSQDYAVRSTAGKAMMAEAMDYAPSVVPSGSYSVRVSVQVQFAIE